MAPTTFGPLDRTLIKLINDPRDLPFIYLTFQCLIYAGCGVGLFFVEQNFWLWAAGYWAVGLLGLLDRFILMLHCTSHRALYKKQFGPLNRLIPVVIGPFLGETPDTYFSHHLGMHHPENNLHDDLSTTMPYQRDSLLHWLHYVGKFFFVGIFLLLDYHRRKDNKKLLRMTLIGELGAFLIVVGLAVINFKAALAVFILPIVVTRTLMMAGNWGQHAFVDPSDPANPYRNSLTCINVRYNRRCFNDGYHINHHVKARCHWSDHPAEFADNMQKYGEQDAIIINGLDQFLVWVMLMLKQHKRLARRFVQLPGAPQRTEEEVVAFLKSRLVAIPRPE